MNRFHSLLVSATAVIAGLALITIAIATGWGAVGRRLPAIRFHGVYEFATIVGLWLYFIGAVYATLRDRHFEAGLGYRLRDGGLMESLRRLVSPMVTLATSIVIAWLAWDTVAWHLESGRQTIQLRVPAYLAPMSVLVGFTLTALISIYRIVDEIRSERVSRRAMPGNGPPGSAGGVHRR